MSPRSAPGATQSLSTAVPARLNPIAAALALGLFGLPAGPASAATITVTTTDQTSVTACTLSDAIVAANTDATVGACPAGTGPDTIVLPASSIFTFTAGVSDNAIGGTDTALPFIKSEVVIQGNGSTVTRAPTAPAFRLLAVFSPGNLSLHQAIVSGGQINFNAGGGIFAGESALLTLTDSTVSGTRPPVTRTPAAAGSSTPAPPP